MGKLDHETALQHGLARKVLGHPPGEPPPGSWACPLRDRPSSAFGRVHARERDLVGLGRCGLRRQLRVGAVLLLRFGLSDHLREHPRPRRQRLVVGVVEGPHPQRAAALPGGVARAPELGADPVRDPSLAHPLADAVPYRCAHLGRRLWTERDAASLRLRPAPELAPQPDAFRGVVRDVPEVRDAGLLTLDVALVCRRRPAESLWFKPKWKVVPSAALSRRCAPAAICIREENPLGGGRRHALPSLIPTRISRCPWRISCATTWSVRVLTRSISRSSARDSWRTIA